MEYWMAKLSSGAAKADVVVHAPSKSAAKDSIFNQFLKLETSTIVWEGEPTFWVVMHEIIQLQECE
jgi:hypothetical protein